MVWCNIAYSGRSSCGIADDRSMEFGLRRDIFMYKFFLMSGWMKHKNSFKRGFGKRRVHSYGLVQFPCEWMRQTKSEMGLSAKCCIPAESVRLDCRPKLLCFSNHDFLPMPNRVYLKWVKERYNF